MDEYKRKGKVCSRRSARSTPHTATWRPVGAAARGLPRPDDGRQPADVDRRGRKPLHGISRQPGRTQPATAVPRQVGRAAHAARSQCAQPRPRSFSQGRGRGQLIDKRGRYARGWRSAHSPRLTRGPVKKGVSSRT